MLHYMSKRALREFSAPRAALNQSRASIQGLMLSCERKTQINELNNKKPVFAGITDFHTTPSFTYISGFGSL